MVCLPIIQPRTGTPNTCSLYLCQTFGGLRRGHQQWVHSSEPPTRRPCSGTTGLIRLLKRQLFLQDPVHGLPLGLDGFEGHASKRSNTVSQLDLDRVAGDSHVSSNAGQAVYARVPSARILPAVYKGTFWLLYNPQCEIFQPPIPSKIPSLSNIYS